MKTASESEPFDKTPPLRFQVFFLVVTFGLYHGLVFFPVLLSLVGPRPYDMEDHGKKEVPQKENAKKTNKDNSTRF